MWRTRCPYFTPRPRSRATASTPFIAGQLFLVLALQCPVHTSPCAQSAQVPLRHMRTHTATNATPISAKTMMSTGAIAHTSIVHRTQNDGACVTFHEPQEPGCAEHPGSVSSHATFAAGAASPTLGRGSRGSYRPRNSAHASQAFTPHHSRVSTHATASTSRPQHLRGSALMPHRSCSTARAAPLTRHRSRGSAYAAAGTAAWSSSPQAPFGIGRKSWNKMSTTNTAATMVQKLNSPSAIRQYAWLMMRPITHAKPHS